MWRYIFLSSLLKYHFHDGNFVNEEIFYPYLFLHNKWEIRIWAWKLRYETGGGKTTLKLENISFWKFAVGTVTPQHVDERCCNLHSFVRVFAKGRNSGMKIMIFTHFAQESVMANNIDPLLAMCDWANSRPCNLPVGVEISPPQGRSRIHRVITPDL